MADSPAKPPAKGGGIMKKKIGPIPVPVALVIVLVVGYLAYRHFQSSSTASTTASQTGTDTTGTTSPGADLSGGASGTGTGTGEGSTGYSLGDIQGLLSTLEQAVPPTNYYFQGASGDTSGTTTPAAVDTTSGGGGGANTDTSTGGSTGPAPLNAATVAASEGFIQYPVLTSSQLSEAFQIGSSSPQSNESLPTVSVAEPASTPGGYPTLNFGTPTPSVTIVNPTVSANKTGASANKKQGIYAIH